MLGKTDEKAITVFLSHKHDDSEVLEHVIEMFTSLGVKVYVDWQDEDMPTKTSGETAVKIKEKIKENDKFILLATENAIQSKWCNWELGFGDSEKYLDNIAIMPITENDGSWSGNEYLQIYPIIKTEYQHSTGNYYVEFGMKRKKLEEWLKS
ncbi:toll/interleukin-1 receptor domain-containing protein [Flagellimonas baculiformis]|uniref:toll/interleukin-1 receptor domain-containing protein n=1 Tax=Flagellimonas baculiformis TaxID=3067310 RepID=UPI00296E8792|nr:toll/interleukin-1 receptor domain-containing protein [Muricauda sp. D6]